MFELQVIVAVSKLIASGLNRTAVNNSLVMLKNYAVEDKGMKVRLLEITFYISIFLTMYKFV